MTAHESDEDLGLFGPGKAKMATDYDAPRKTDEELNEDSIEELKTRRNDKNSGKVDEDEAEAARGQDPECPVLGSAPVGWFECRVDCCPNLRELGRPALCQVAADPS